MRVAALGFWHVHGNDYAGEAAAHPAVELVAVWDDDADRAQRAAQTHGVPARGLEDILADPTVDGVIICSPTSAHLDLAVASARAGKHIFIEKVLAATRAEARHIVDAVEQAGVTLVVSMRRTDQGFARQVVDLVAGGAIGTVTSMRVQDGHPFALPTATSPTGMLAESFYDPEAAQGGALIDLCHPVYLTALVLGAPERVSAQLGFVTGRSVEDNAGVVMQYADGAIATVATSYVTSSSPFVLEVHGTRGSILYSEPGIGALVQQHRSPRPAGATTSAEDVARLRYWTLDDGPVVWHELAPVPDPPAAFAQWVDLAAAGEPATANVALALALTAIIEAAYVSARRGV